jgi:hypothetical protein
MKTSEGLSGPGASVVPLAGGRGKQGFREKFLGVWWSRDLISSGGVRIILGLWNFELSY